jgi:hypothetical protein
MTPLERAILDAAEAWAASTGPESALALLDAVRARQRAQWSQRAQREASAVPEVSATEITVPQDVEGDGEGAGNAR